MSTGAPAFETLVEVYLSSVKRYGHRELFGEKKNGTWAWMTYERFGQKVDELRGGLAQLGIRPGDKIAVISNNRSEWAIAAYAAYGLGAAYVPMYEAQHPKDWEYILKDCGAKLLFVPNKDFVEKIGKLKNNVPALQHIVRWDGGADEPDTLASVSKLGAEHPSPITNPKPTDLAGLIYTSGTTGNPKGVMLSQSNLARNVSAMHECFPMSQDDRSLSFLPWAHSFGQVVELHGLFSMGASMAIAESNDKIIPNLAEVRPTLLFSVPLIFNRIYDGLQKRIASETPVKRKLFERALKVSRQRRELAMRGRTNVLLDVQHAVLDRLVFEKVRERFGGRLKYAFAGGAAMSRDVAEFIEDLGIMVYEGYGLTETSPIFTANYPGSRKIGSVGKAIPGTRIEIDKSVNPSDDPKQGEIIAHGHNVMMGYYNLAEENERVFTKDGGFRTGDLGYLDDEGYLYITGRVKEQYKLENGKYVVPGPIEQAIALSPYVSNVMVHGANKPFNVAVIVADAGALKKWAGEKGLPAEPYEALLARPEVQSLYEQEIATHAKSIKGYERPQKFLLVSEEWSTANEMLTPSLKLKRRNVIARYNDGIEKLYKEAATKKEAASGAHAA